MPRPTRKKSDLSIFRPTPPIFRLRGIFLGANHSFGACTADFRDFRDCKDFRRDFRDFRYFKVFRLDFRDFSDFKSFKYPNGCRPDFKEYRSILKGVRPYSRDFSSDFKDFRFNVRLNVSH